MKVRLLSAGSSASPPTHMTFWPLSFTPVTRRLHTGRVCSESTHFLPSFTPIAALQRERGARPWPRTRVSRRLAGSVRPASPLGPANRLCRRGPACRALRTRPARGDMAGQVHPQERLVGLPEQVRIVAYDTERPLRDRVDERS